MNKISRFLIVLLASFMLMPMDLRSQEFIPWPQQSSWISAYVGFVGVVVPVGLNYEHLWHRDNVHLGTSGGVVMTVYPEESETFLGGYLAFIFLSGTGDHHFEGRLGASVHPFLIAPRWRTGGTDFPFIPVVTVGYRYQPPDSRQFFRVSFGTGGIGIGMGFKLGEKFIQEPL